MTTINDIQVSVVMITYGHDKFIKQAVESILEQECTFNFELIIGNDASPDNTDIVIKEILNSNPLANKVKYFNHEKNIGFMENHIFVLQKAKGKYIAICEGDDYWTDRKKLQKQFDFLEQNHDFSLVFHDCNMFYQDKNELGSNGIVENIDNREYSRLEIFEKWIIPTGSVFFRTNSINEKLYQIYRDKRALFGDTYTNLFISKSGKIFGLKDKMSVYRIHQGGLTSSHKNEIEKQKKFIIHWKFIIECFGNSFLSKKIKERFSEAYFNLARLSFVKKDIVFLKYMLLSLKYNKNVFLKLSRKKFNKN